ncbi:MAG: glycosyltransferase [Betaproteobacteria bacterium]|nr:glycosyltransferase [Betaproteobacteria bacterium]
MQINRDLSDVSTITVTFNPDLALLKSQLAVLPPESFKLIIDNASDSKIREQIKSLVGQTHNARLVWNAENIGLAAALNLGVSLLREHDPNLRFVLLLDQDSEPQPGSIHTLVKAFETLTERGLRVGCVGPTLVDATTNLEHGFHQATRWRWRRVYPRQGMTDAVPCANLNGSGTLVPIDLFQSLGGLDEAFFIDHVDTAWSFRVLAAGYGLFGIPNAVFKHRMGQASVRFWLLGWRIWPARAPRRHYFLFRNAIFLIRRSEVLVVWKSWAVAKLLLVAGIHGMFDTERVEQWRQMWRGVRDGLRKPER